MSNEWSPATSLELRGVHPCPLCDDFKPTLQCDMAAHLAQDHDMYDRTPRSVALGRWGAIQAITCVCGKHFAHLGDFRAHIVRDVMYSTIDTLLPEQALRQHFALAALRGDR